MDRDRSPGNVLREGGSLSGDDLEAFGGDHFGAKLLGLTLDEVALDHVRAHLDCDERHHQPFGIVHGGVWCAVVESMASIGGAMNAIRQDKQVVGVNNSTDFLRAHRTGRVDGLAEPLHVGRTQQLWQVVLTRASDDKVVARGQVRLQNVDASRRLG
jgi:1,4-dihydroxy-2-naphthoyl-CoA hydrolase